MILEPPMISIAVIALTVCHPGTCFQGSWSTAKSAYKSGEEKLYSMESDDERHTADGTMFDQNGDVEMETLSKQV